MDKEDIKYSYSEILFNLKIKEIHELVKIWMVLEYIIKSGISSQKKTNTLDSSYEVSKIVKYRDIHNRIVVTQ